MYNKGYCDDIIYNLPEIKKSFQFCSVQCSEGYTIKKNSILTSYNNYSLLIFIEVFLKKMKSASEPPDGNKCNFKKREGIISDMDSKLGKRSRVRLGQHRRKNIR